MLSHSAATCRPSVHLISPPPRLIISPSHRLAMLSSRRLAPASVAPRFPSTGVGLDGPTVGAGDADVSLLGRNSGRCDMCGRREREGGARWGTRQSNWTHEPWRRREEGGLAEDGTSGKPIQAMAEQQGKHYYFLRKKCKSISGKSNHC